jgi:hypothetical protein
MFNLDQAILEWRQQMATGCIKAPDVLEELESHLRDDVEQQVRSGVGQRSAFDAAVQRVGERQTLRKEFRKVSTGLAKRDLFGFSGFLLCAWLANKQTFILSSIGGLLVGAIIFAAGMWLEPTSGYMPIISFLTWPVTSLHMWWEVSTHGHSGVGILSFMTAILVYWVVLGVLVGISCRKIMRWRHTSHAA